MTELPKTFDPAEIESRWYAHWESSGQFRPERPGAEPWTIVNPPPNVTGSLHIGHALDNTLQDILVRHARLKGKDALWVVGTDHAGIATQMVVERQMAERQQKRTDFSREQFVEKVWQWKEESGGEITQQLRRLGCSMDWANERFTMDEGFSKAVLKVFVDLYNQGLIYRDKRLVNWDPDLGTAISDLEVETREIKGSFWHLRYPLEDGSGFIEVATTRPETMLADMAVAVNATDARYTHLVGKKVRLPITGRLIPIITDDHADPELGSGAVKITPGHDFNDFEVGKRAGFKAGEMLNMLDAKAQVTQTSDGLIPDDLLGVDRFWARKLVVERLKEGGFLVPHIDKDGVEHDAEPRTIQTPYGDRSGEVIEPWLTDQWYVDAETLAKGPIVAVKSGAIKIVPKSWEKTFFNWMENIQPWCVSRQLWWGHRIPAWFGPDLDIETDPMLQGLDEFRAFVALTEEDALAKAREYYSKAGWEVSTSEEFSDIFEDTLEWLNANPGKRPPVRLFQDPDVLDTWFSSALWPFATMGWPDADTQPPFASSEVETPIPDQRVSTSLDTNGKGGARASQLNGRYPNDVLISGFDILFFWDARMMMQGMHFMGDVPFRTLYLHGLVRAADGQKMSKSKGNVVNPLGLIDRYGADALRFFMAAMESQGRDIKMDEKRVEGYRNFATKLWNAARFCQANGIGASTTLEAPKAKLAVNKWIIGEVVETLAKLDKSIEKLRFDAAANAIYHFAWHTFCDQYVEAIKVDVRDDSREVVESMDFEAVVGSGERLRECREVASWVFDQILVMLHPFMPFITEELWHAMGARGSDLIVARWPNPQARRSPTSKLEVQWVEGLIREIRQMRNALGIPPKRTLFISFEDVELKRWRWLRRNAFNINRRTNVLVGITAPDESLNAEVSAEMNRFAASKGFTDEMRMELMTANKAQLPYDGCVGLLDLGRDFDLEAERVRLNKALEAAAKERDSLADRLDNPSFVERAKPEAVEKARADHAEKSAEADRLSAALARLG